MARRKSSSGPVPLVVRRAARRRLDGLDVVMLYTLFDACGAPAALIDAAWRDTSDAVVARWRAGLYDERDYAGRSQFWCM